MEKVSGGLYLAPRETRFGKAPAKPEKLVERFLKDDRFLLVSSSAYNGLGVGTTQLYNESVVYNLKRHGRFDLGGQTYDFRKKPSVPRRLTQEVLLVDLLQNLDRLGEPRLEILPRALARARQMNPARLLKAARDFGSVRSERLLRQAFGDSLSGKDLEWRPTAMRIAVQSCFQGGGGGPGTSVEKPGVSPPTATDALGAPWLWIGAYRPGARRR